MAWPLKPMMCEPAKLIVTSSADRPDMRSAASTAWRIASTAASGLTMTPLRRPRASASPMPTMSKLPPSPGSPMMHVTRLVPMLSPVVYASRFAMRFIASSQTGGSSECCYASLTCLTRVRLRAARLFVFTAGGRGFVNSRGQLRAHEADDGALALRHVYVADERAARRLPLLVER